MLNINDYEIQCIEQEILTMYQSCRYNAQEYERLLLLRRYIINHRVLEHQEEILPDIIAFNDALTDALKKMYDEAYQLWDKIKVDKDFGDDPEVSAICFLDDIYPKAHPVQKDDRQEFWYALDDYRHSSYQNGITLVPLSINRSHEKEPFESLIGMDCPPPNWNEGLDAELTKDLHLTSAFHNIFFHMGFAITDFIYVRQFEKEIKIELNYTIQ